MSINVLRGLALGVAAVAWSYPAIAEEVNLTTDQISHQMVGKELSGYSKDGKTVWMKIGKDGTAWGKVGNREITMAYEIKDNKWCRTIGSSFDCQTVKRDGDTIKLYSSDGSLSSYFRAND